MPPTQRKPATTLTERLLAHPYRFEFAQAVRIARAWLARLQQDASVSKPPALWFRHRTSLAFPPSDVAAISVESSPSTPEEARAGASQIKRIDITPSFSTMLGISAYLPYHYTEDVLEVQARTGTDAQTCFFDLLAQRATLLHHEAWEKDRVYPATVLQRDDHLQQVQNAIAGFPMAASGQASSAPMTLFAAFYAGVLRHHASSPQVLQNVLSEYFDVPFQVQPFVGAWRTLEQDERMRLGQGCTLAVGLLLGPRGYSKSERVRLRIGPLTLDQYERFLPRTQGATALSQIVGMFRVASLTFEVQLVLRAEDVPQMTLQRSNRPASALGYATCLASRADGARDHDALHYELDTHCPEKPDGKHQ